METENGSQNVSTKLYFFFLFLLRVLFNKSIPY